MKKCYFLILAMLLMCLTTFGQEQGQDVKSSGLYKHYQMKYVYAMKYNDWRAASEAMYGLISLDPSDDSLKVNLSYLYLENNIFASALFAANDVLTRQPENLQALQISAISYENMGLVNKAIENYESLYLLTEQMDILYNLAAMQFDTGRELEAITNAKIVSESPKSTEIKLNLQAGEDGQQEVLLNAAAYNLLGIIEKKRGNTSQAKEYFDKALEIQPDFELAKKGLNEMD